MPPAMSTPPLYRFLTLLLVTIGLLQPTAAVASNADAPRPQLTREFFVRETGVPPEAVTAVATAPNGEPWLIAAGRLLHRNSGKWERLEQPQAVSTLLAV